MFPDNHDYLVYLIEDDLYIREALIALFETINLKVMDFKDPLLFLKHFEENGLKEISCIILDIRLPHISGLELFKILKSKDCYQPIIFITAHGQIDMAVNAIKDGVFDFIAKPFNNQYLIDSVQKAFQHLHNTNGLLTFKRHSKKLTPREKEIIELLLQGKKNKEIGFQLDLSISTIELARANILNKLQLKNMMEILKFQAIINSS